MLQVSSAKAVGPLLISGILAIVAYVIGGGDPAVVLAPVTGLVTYGIVYFFPWAETSYAKTIASLAVPLIVMLVSGFTTGVWGVTEFLLALQGVTSALATYNAPRYIRVVAEPSEVPPGSVATSR